MSAQPRPSDFFKNLTARILAALRKGVVPWRRPWRSLTPTRHTGLPFTGTNSLVLSLAADQKGYANPFWLTRAQGRRCGAMVLDGEEGTWVLRPLPFSAPDRRRGERPGPPIPLMEPYEVFNAEQFDRLPPRFRIDEEGFAPGPRGRIDVAEEFFKAIGANIVPGGDRAAYNRAEDIIRMPIFPSFDDPVRYYSTLAHEAIHWTGHCTRMGREFGVRFGDLAYAFEEIIAELGASFVMSRLGLPSRVERDHAPYIGHWISVLENDDRAIHRAASHAQRAADFLVIATASGRVRELMERPLDDRAWIVVYLDIVEIGPHPLVGAVGVDADGAKRVLGLRLADGDPDDWPAAVKELLRDVVSRGVHPDRRRLVVTDGSAQLRNAALAEFGADTYVQACRPHREREVLSRLRGKKDRDRAREALREAWASGAEEGPRLLDRLAGQLERDGWVGAANRLRAGSGDLFTVDRFRLDSRMAKSLVTTDVIDCASSRLRRQICGVPRWADPEVALAWAAASFLNTERGYMKIPRSPAPSAPQGPFGPDRDAVRPVGGCAGRKMMKSAADAAVTAPSPPPTTPPQQHIKRTLAPMPAARGNARHDQRAGRRLVQPRFKPTAKHAPGIGERVAPPLTGDHENATQAPMSGLGQECRDLPRGIPAREAVQVQPGVDRNPAATQRDRLAPVQPVERADSDPSGRGTGVTSFPAGPAGTHALPDDRLLD